MNTLNSCKLMNALDIVEDCAQFNIDDVSSPFVMANLTKSGLKYTFGFWIKSDTPGSITVKEQVMETTTDWKRQVVTYIADSTDLQIFFTVPGVYYISRPKLEDGNMPTSWCPSNEDVKQTINTAQTSANEVKEAHTATSERLTATESLVQKLSNSIATLVTDGNGASLMVQDEDGWHFNIGETEAAVNAISQNLELLQEETGDTGATVEALKQAVGDLEKTAERVRIGVWEGEPCIELGESDSDKSLMITNTRILFRVGSNTPTEVTTYGLVTDNIEVKGEIKQGGYVQIVTPDGGWGLLWKGVSD